VTTRRWVSWSASCTRNTKVTPAKIFFTEVAPAFVTTPNYRVLALLVITAY
jgi:hypothetical protein